MEYVTKKGDTFDVIAYQIYGDAELIAPLIEANPSLTETAVFNYGITVTVPDISIADENIFLPPWRRS